MNGGRGRRNYPSPSTSTRPSLSHSWRNVHDSSPHTPVQGGASFSERQISGSLDRELKHTWQVKQHNAACVVSEKNDNITLKGRHDQARVVSNSDQRMPDSLHRKQYSSWQQVRGNNLGGALSRNNERLTSVPYQGEQQGSFTIKGTSSNVNSTCDSGHDNHLGSLQFKSREDNKLDRSLVESVDHLTIESISSAEVLEPSENNHNKNNEHTSCSSLIEEFDICPPKLNSVVTLKPSLLSKNKEKRNELKNSTGGPNVFILRSGMVLLKSYLSSSEQASILKTCRTYGVGPGGFYQPLLREGAKLHLKMMCFGKFWDPETSKYGDVRPIDGAKPPSVPRELLGFVDRAIKDSQYHIAKSCGVKNVENILPSVKPDICLVNYYATTGRLGLHQDKDESRESLDKGLPIVSFSIGDSAEFLYGDERDADKANKVMIESGDVLIFGGKSRHIFHGVSTIKPNTALNLCLKKQIFALVA